MPEQPSSSDPVPVPVTVVLPDGQELRARLYAWHQTPTGWQGDVGVPLYRNREDHSVEPAEYRVWLDAPGQIRAIDGVDYADVPKTRLPKPTFVDAVLGERRPSGWVMQGDHGQGVVHAPDCPEAPPGAVTLSVDRALTLAQLRSLGLVSVVVRVGRAGPGMGVAGLVSGCSRVSGPLSWGERLMDGIAVVGLYRMAADVVSGSRVLMR